jgi:hypothetical protein
MATVALERKPSKFSPGFLAWLAFIGLCLMIGLVAALQVFVRLAGFCHRVAAIHYGFKLAAKDQRRNVDISAPAFVNTIARVPSGW